MRVRAPAIVVTLSVLALPVAALGAPSKEQCVAAYQGAQVDMKQSNLGAAREKLAACLSPGCPSALHSDCADWLKEVDRRQPSVVLSFKDKAGAVASDVTVELDGKVVGKSDGKSVDVDPGERTFRFTPKGEAPVDVRLVVREGEKSQRVDGVSSLYVAPVEKPKGGLEPSRPEAPTVRERPVPWTVYALGGLGLVGAGGFAGFGLAGTSGKSDLEACKPSCLEDDVSSVRTKFLIADVSLVVSVVALGAATVLFLTRPEVARRSEADMTKTAKAPAVRWLGSGVRLEL
jgi:hypothetical protein